jgi:hypothetical protein
MRRDIMHRPRLAKWTTLLAAIALLGSCIRIGGCREEALDGAEVDIYFNVTPDERYNTITADVLLDDALVGNVGNEQSMRLTIPVGDHEIKVDASGHRAEQKKFRIINTNGQEFRFLLHEH